MSREEDVTARSVADVDWDTWQPTIRATLLFVVEAGRVLLIHKKRGIGAGLVNGPGGKIDPGESAAECAIRETFEEVCVTATGVEEAGDLRFQFVDGTAIHCTVFRANGLEGEPTETDEAAPAWYPVDAVPFDRMWADDELWFPHLLSGQRFAGRCVFDADELLDAVIEVADPAA
jgi:8-oxo-dGTP diphosphatase